MLKNITLREDIIATMAMMSTNPLAPDTPPAVLQGQLDAVERLMDRLLAGEPVDGLSWDAVPPEVRQMFLLAGLAALGSAITTQINN